MGTAQGIITSLRLLRRTMRRRPPTTLLDAVGDHLEHCRRRGLSPGTIHAKSVVLRRVEAELPVPMIAATWPDLDAWARKRQPRVLPSTWRTELSHVRGFYAWCLRFDHLSVDPGRLLEAGRPARRLPRPIPDHAYVEIFDSTSDPIDRVILVMAGDCGLRRAEIAGLDWSDIDLHLPPAGMVRVLGKGNKERIVPLSLKARAVLLELPHRRGPVIRSTRTGRAVTPSIIAHRASLILGPHDYTLHQLRHTAGTALTELHGIRVAQELLGHSSPAITALYAQVAMTHAAAAVEAASARRWAS